MRNEYRKILIRNFRQKHYSYLANQFFKIPLVWLGSKIKQPLTGPIQAILIVTYRCNLQCQMCDLWRRPSKTKSKELSTTQFLAIINDLAKLKTTGIGFTGGEPLLRNDLVQLITHAHRQGMVTHLATNGVLLGQKISRALLKSGLDAISISLDGPTAAIHDHIRGQKGTFERVLNNIKQLHQLRTKMKSDLSLTINCAISALNAPKIIDLINIAPGLGIDGIGFIPVQSSGLGKKNGRYNQLRLKSNRQVNATINQIIEIKKQNHQLIDNTFGYLRLMKDFFGQKKLPIPCLVGYHTTIIDAYGDVFSCIPFSNLHHPLGNLGKSNFLTMWQSSEYQRQRKEISPCRQCYWNCHSEVNLLFNRK